MHFLYNSLIFSEIKINDFLGHSGLFMLFPAKSTHLAIFCLIEHMRV